ncbi:MAG: c-type cytochrome [Ignavibacteriales bacterium]
MSRRCLVVGFIAAFALSISLLVNAAERGNPAEGKKIFTQRCWGCHGLTGHGDGPAANSFEPKPRNLSDATYVSTLTDERMFRTISEGGAAMGKSPFMPPWKGVLSETDIWDVIAYIRQDICKCQYKGEEKEE